MRELNRLGVTGVIDAGGGFQNYPEDYEVIEELHADGELTVRIAYNLFTQKPKRGTRGLRALGRAWLTPGPGRRLLPASTARARCWSTPRPTSRTSVEPRPDMPPTMEAELERGRARCSPSNRWPFRLHATYDETIGRALDVFEKVNREVPLRRPALVLRPRRDDQPTATSSASRRSAAASRSSTAWPTRASTSSSATAPRPPRRTPPVAPDARRGVPVGAGTDATRVASYNPWVALYWLVTGKTRRRHAALSDEQPARPRGGAAAVDRGQRLVLGRGGQEGRDRAGPARRPGGAVGATTSPCPRRRSRTSSRC